MNEYQYILEPYSGKKSRCQCPQCCKGGVFSRYIDAKTGQHISDEVGRCNREINCGYHYTPGQFIKEGGKLFSSKTKAVKPTGLNNAAFVQPVSFMPLSVTQGSLKRYGSNNFVRYLNTIFDEGVVKELINRYAIGTSQYWPGATVFWQSDFLGKIRAGKIMLYNPEKGKRVKEPKDHISWVHTVLKLTGFNLEQCFFGEHLLKDNRKPVAVVESEKTAIIASVYFPDFVWLASGGISNLNVKMCKVLKGRDVYLFPDLKAYEKWKKKAEELSRLNPETKFQVDGLLEKYASAKEREDGQDLADYVVEFNKKEFLPSESENSMKDKMAFQNIVGIKAGAKNLSRNTPFDRLKEKYPNLSILAERVGLEIIN